jgi:hypothetical protein
MRALGKVVVFADGVAGHQRDVGRDELRVRAAHVGEREVRERDVRALRHEVHRERDAREHIVAATCARDQHALRAGQAREEWGGGERHQWGL